jgi:hypothetical protein
LPKYRLENTRALDFGWEKGGTEQVEYTFSVEKEMNMIN